MVIHQHGGGVSIVSDRDLRAVERAAGVPVVLPQRIGHIGVRHRILHFVGPGPHGIGPPDLIIPGVFRDELIVHDGQRRQFGQRRPIRLVIDQVHGHLVFGQIALFKVDNPVPEGGHLTAAVLGKLEGRHDIHPCHLGAIGERNAILQGDTQRGIIIPAPIVRDWGIVLCRHVHGKQSVIDHHAAKNRRLCGTIGIERIIGICRPHCNRGIRFTRLCLGAGRVCDDVAAILAAGGYHQQHDYRQQDRCKPCSFA